MSKSDLASKILVASDAYYNGTPLMSDQEFDFLVEKLRVEDTSHPVLTMVGCKVREDSKLSKVHHSIPMGSLHKVNTQEEFKSWACKVSGFKTKFVIQEKLDGISVELLYNNGEFVQAVSRGDGEVGEDITHNVRFMQGVPANVKGFDGSVRGEIILNKSVFSTHFMSDYSNTRNTVSGLSRKKDTNFKVSHFEVIAFDVVGRVGFTTEKEKLDFLHQNSFSAVEHHIVTIDTAVEWYDYYTREYREEVEHDIDGLVVKVNNLAEQISYGEQDGRPKGQIAWKFDALAKETVLTGVTWQVGRGGRITPVAELAPVEIGGVTISRASLHNCSNIKKLGLSLLNSTVLLSRRNDVIPYVESVLVDGTGKAVTIPTTCPTCTQDIDFHGEYLVCNNTLCGGRVYGDIEKWVDVLEMRDIGPSFIDEAMYVFGVKDPSGLYTMTENDLSKMSGFADKKAKKIYDVIQSKKVVTLSTLLSALNISGIGKSVSALLVKNGIDTLNRVLELEEEELLGIKGIGEVTISTLIEGIAAKKNTIQKLISAGVSIKDASVATGHLGGKSFCFTGALDSGMSRTVCHKLVLLNGGEVKTSVTKDLTYLVQANKKSVSTKTQKAVKYGTVIIDEDDFLELIKFSGEMLQQVE